MGGNFKKFHNSLYCVSDSQKKNSLPYLDHGFRDTPSKLGTNRPKIYPILSSTSVLRVFAKSGGGMAKKIIFGFTT